MIGWQESGNALANPPIRTVNTNTEPTTEETQPEQPARFVSREPHVDTYRDKARRVGRTVAPKLKNVAIKGAKTLAKGFVKGTVAGTGALVGGAIAAASSGDLGKTAQAMAAGAATGSALASRGMGGASRLKSEVRNNVQEVRDAWHGDDSAYKARQQQKQINKVMKNAELRNAISSKIGEKGLKEMEKSGDLKKYVENGVQSADEMVAMQQLKENTGINTDAAIGVHHMHRDIAGGKDTTNMSGRDKVENAIQGKYSREVTNGNQQQADMLRDKTMGYMDEYSRILFKHN